MLKRIGILIAILIVTTATAEGRQRGKRAPEPQAPGFSFAMLGSDLVATARMFIGSNPTGWDHVWCARFGRMVLQRSGRPDPGPDYDKATNWLRIGRPAPKGAPGSWVVWGSHLGLVVQPTRPGYAIVISGNTGPKGSRSVMEEERRISNAMGFRYL